MTWRMPPRENTSNTDAVCCLHRGVGVYRLWHSTFGNAHPTRDKNGDPNSNTYANSHPDL